MTRSGGCHLAGEDLSGFLHVFFITSSILTLVIFSNLKHFLLLLLECPIYLFFFCSADTILSIKDGVLGGTKCQICHADLSVIYSHSEK